MRNIAGSHLRSPRPISSRKLAREVARTGIREHSRLSGSSVDSEATDRYWLKIGDDFSRMFRAPKEIERVKDLTIASCCQ